MTVTFFSSHRDRLELKSDPIENNTHFVPTLAKSEIPCLDDNHSRRKKKNQWEKCPQVCSQIVLNVLYLVLISCGL